MLLTDLPLFSLGKRQGCLIKPRIKVSTFADMCHSLTLQGDAKLMLESKAAFWQYQRRGKWTWSLHFLMSFQKCTHHFSREHKKLSKKDLAKKIEANCLSRGEYSRLLTLLMA
jgi:hypothetical protein